MQRDRTLYTQTPPCLIPQESVKLDYCDFYKHTPYESRHSIHQELEWREQEEEECRIGETEDAGENRSLTRDVLDKYCGVHDATFSLCEKRYSDTNCIYLQE